MPSAVEAPCSQRVVLDFARTSPSTSLGDAGEVIGRIPRSNCVRLFLFLLALFLPAFSPAETRAPVTILVSIDGFRPDYLDRSITPRLNALKAAGASAAMRPSFPSLTFPNHWTLVTGLRPDRNGIVGNTMEDVRKPGVVFTLSNSDPFWWNAAEPIWITAERQGVRSALMFWPGSQVDFAGARAHDWWPYAKELPEPQRVDGVLDWLRRPAAIRPRFVTLYFDTVDTAGHRNGPDGAKTNDAIRAVDAQIGRLVDGLAELGQPANLVVVADHGMAATSEARQIQLWKVARAKDFRSVTAGPYAGIEPLPRREKRLARALLRPHEHMTCYRKAELPPALHYGANARVPSFVCLAEIGWLIEGTPRAPDKPFDYNGAHGYDPGPHRAMDALFIASGPAFVGGVALPAFDNVDVYPLIARLIGVTPIPGDGSADVFTPALRR